MRLARTLATSIRHSYPYPLPGMARRSFIHPAENARRPVCVSAMRTPGSRKNSPHVHRLPNLLRKGVPARKVRVPRIIRPGLSRAASAIRRMSRVRCCPSASAVTTTKLAGNVSRMCAKAVLSAAPLPRFCSWRSNVTPGNFSSCAKISAAAVEPSSTTTIPSQCCLSSETRARSPVPGS